MTQVTESVVVINPGTLSKRKGAGTYARMTVHPPEVEPEGSGSVVSHKLWGRAKVDIVRI